MKMVLAAFTALALLAGCANQHMLTSEVASWGEWPAARKPATYAFDRLPSQQPSGQVAQGTLMLEAAARPALTAAGFKPAAAGETPDILVQVAARTDRTVALWADPLWWRGGWGVSHRAWAGPWVHPRWNRNVWVSDHTRFDNEVALLLRDRASGQPLYEARASYEGFARADGPIFSAMFSAALQAFPKVQEAPARVAVALPRPVAAAAQ